MFKGLVKWARIKSPWILHMNCGSCNGCDIEILAALIPRLDAERFGVLLKGSTTTRRRACLHRASHKTDEGTIETRL